MKKRFLITLSITLFLAQLSNAQIQITSNTSGFPGTNPLGTDNIALGTGAGANLAAGALYNTFVGDNAGNQLRTGDENCYYGHLTGQGLSGTPYNAVNKNTAYGATAAQNIGGIQNTYLGYSSGYSSGVASNTGNYNAFVGAYTGTVCNTSAYTSALGYHAGDNLKAGDYNTFIGSYTATPSGTTSITYATAIGAKAEVLNDNSMVLGAPYSGSFTNGAVKVGIGMNNPSHQFHTNGDMRFQGVNAQTANTSDTKWLTMDGTTGEVHYRNLSPASASCGTTTARSFPFWSATNADLVCTSPIYVDNVSTPVNIGIGETAPQNRLHVRNGAGALGTFYNNYLNPDGSLGIPAGSFSTLGTSTFGANNSTNVGTSGYTIDDNSNNYGAYNIAFGDKTIYNSSNPIQPSNVGTMSFAKGTGLPGTLPFNFEWQINMGVFGRGEGCNSYNFGGAFLGFTPTTCCPNSQKTQSIGVQGEARNAYNNYGVVGYVFHNDPSNPNCLQSSAKNLAGLFNSDISVAGTIYPSDQNLKTNIKSYSNALDELRKLKISTYEFKEVKQMILPEGLQIGIMAQDLERVFPGLVKQVSTPVYFSPTGEKMESLTYKGVKYEGLIPVALQAIKELDAKTDEIKTLKSQLEEQGRLIEELCNGGCETQLLKKENTAGTNSNNYIKQNRPNPFSSSTVIDFFITDKSGRAEIQVYNLQGMLLKGFSIENKGQGNVTIAANEFAPGTYTYSLIVDGTTIDTKIMVITK